MRRVIISDLHFGDRAGGDLLRYRWARERLWPLLEGADELMLLGDTFEFIFQQMEQAIAAARPFFAELNHDFPHLRIHKIPGNHDYHLVARAADERRERKALGLEDRSAFKVEPAERLIRALTPRLEVISSYPTYIENDTCYTHGHYTATHLRGFFWRNMDWLQWRIWNQPRRYDGLTAVEYEALYSPLYELVYQTAQLPNGPQSQQAWEEYVRRILRIGRVPAQVAQAVVQAGKAAGRMIRRRRELLPSPIDEPEAEPHEYLMAMGKVAINLELDKCCQKIVFAHSHYPVEGESVPAYLGLTFYNSGSWLLDSRNCDRPDYRDTAWPGTVLVENDGEIRLVRLLEDLDLDDIHPHRWQRDEQPPHQFPQLRKPSKRWPLGPRM